MPVISTGVLATSENAAERPAVFFSMATGELHGQSLSFLKPSGVLPILCGNCPQARGKRKQDQPAMNDRRILLAEDNPEHATRLQGMLETLHYRVELVNTGLAALQRLRADDTPEMALLSASLSPIGGIEIGLELRRRSRRRKLWLMLMSDTPSADQVEMATNAGFDEFLVQPVDMQELRMRIRTAERVQSLYQEICDTASAVEFHATHDPLTATWRREAMLDFLFKETDRVLRIHSPLSIVLLDIDGFGRENQRHGQKAADKLLQSLAGRLRQQLRSYDLLGRYANDEFLLALPGCTGLDAAAKTERVRQVIARRPFTVNGDEISLTACFGVAESMGRSPLIVLRDAERALTLAKQAGPNTVRIFDESNQPPIVPQETWRRPDTLPAS
jgi:diguanylate cyclase (GGDEF)-like protein